MTPENSSSEQNIRNYERVGIGGAIVALGGFVTATSVFIAHEFGFVASETAEFIARPSFIVGTVGMVTLLAGARLAERPVIGGSDESRSIS